jgi:diacylglycerol diphosphate phosphatase/phosphatidate phosphatase
VTVGSILGLIVAYFSYRQYYPDLAEEHSHRPYSPRIKDESSGPILPVHDQSRNQRYDPAGAGRGYDSFELDGTVERPGPERLRDAWKEHDESGERENRADPDRHAGSSNH